MGKYAQLVMGPAGSGKSTYVNTIRTHSEEFAYPVSIDIKELVTVDEVMEDLNYGPNGGLIYAIEYLMDNVDWLEDQLGDFEDDYLLIDCPGQIELYSHLNAMENLVKMFQQLDYKICGIYLLDSSFIDDSSKFIAGVLMCLSAMVRLEIPHINILSKMDLTKKKFRRADDEEEMEDFLDKYADPDMPSLLANLNLNSSKKFHKLNQSIASLIDDHNLVGFVTLDPTDEDSVTSLLAQVDSAIQWGEDEDVQVKDYNEEEPDDLGL